MDVKTYGKYKEVICNLHENCNSCPFNDFDCDNVSSKVEEKENIVLKYIKDNNIKEDIKTYKYGIDEVWEFCRKLFCDYICEDLYEIFDTDDIEIIMTENSYHEAIEKIQKWENNKIKRGSIVEHDGKRKIVLNIDFADNAYVWDGNSGTVTKIKKDLLKRIGTAENELNNLIEAFKWV